jgi:hypothetical protein
MVLLKVRVRAAPSPMPHAHSYLTVQTAMSCPGKAKGSAPWFPKNLYTRARGLLGLPPGRDPFDRRARIGLRPSSFSGE